MESRRILIVTSGGTISSLLAGDQISINSAAEVMLAREIRELAAQLGLPIEIQRAANVPSSSLAPENWGSLAKIIAEKNKAGFERFVITHGTDTLHYTAAFLAIQFAGWPIRVCLTGAFFPINHEQSDGRDNLSCSLQTTASDRRLSDGVYVCISRAIGVAPALTVLPPSFDQTDYRLLYHQFSEKERMSARILTETLAFRTAIATPEQLENAKRSVLFARLYPGIDMRLFESAANATFLILEGYHSGTGSISEGADSLLALRRKRPDLMICLGSIPSPVVQSPYEASTELATNGIWVYRDVPPHVLFAGALLGKANGLNATDTMVRFSNFRI